MKKYQNLKNFISKKYFYSERSIFYKWANQTFIQSLGSAKYWFSDYTIYGRLIIFDISLNSLYILHNKFDQQMSKFDEKK